MLERPLLLLARRDLIAEMVRKEFLTRYHGSMIGIAWTQLYPLLLFAVYSTVFSVIFPTSIARFPLYTFVGIVLWRFVSVALQWSSTSITTNHELLSRISFPAEVLPVAAVLIAGVDLAASHVILVGAALAYGVWPSWSWLALPILAALLGATCLGLGLGLAAATVYLRDVRWFLDVGLFMLLHLSPVVWSDAGLSDGAQWLIRANPLGSALIAYRHALMDGAFPDGVGLAVQTIEALAALAIGFLVFQRSRRGFVDAA